MNKNLTVINIEALESLLRGREIKVLLDAKKIYFAHLNLQHNEMERSVFGLSGDLTRTVPGYIKPENRTVQLRTCKYISLENMKSILKTIENMPELSPLDGYSVQYGSQKLGKLSIKTEGFRYDLHIHTERHSACSMIDPFDLVKRAIDNGLHGIAITEHHYYWPELELAELKKYASRFGKLHIFSGQEIKTAEGGELLVFGYPEYVEPDQRLSTLIPMLHEAGAAVVAAHPCRKGQSFPESKIEIMKVHSMEVFNEESLGRQDFIKRVIKRRGLPSFGGSDAHCLPELGRIVTVFDNEITTEKQLVQSLIKGEYHSLKVDKY